ncbi:MAG TPA: hypothetical protein VLT45_19220 [Kofleriaceae bacterium]|nr:hypothetical protein [Kofleriaceae bacterium]
MRYLAPLVALVACKHSPPADCAKKAAEVASFLRAADHGGQIFQLAPLTPPLRDDLTERGTTAPVIAIAPDAITYQGQLVEGRDDLVSLLRATHEQIADDLAQGRSPKRPPPDPGLIAIVADEKAPLASVATAADAALSSGFPKAMLVFRHTPVTPPPRNPVDDELDKLFTSSDPSSKATAIAQFTSDKIKGCPALVKSFGAVSAVEDDKAKFLIDSIEPSLKECGCAVDPYTVRSIMWRILADPEPAVVLHVRLDRGAPPIHAATWGEASKQLTTPNTAVWFN